MDFKSLVSKISSLDDPIDLPKAPEKAAPIQLNEDAQLRVLAGTSTILAEAAKMKKDEVKEAEDRIPAKKKETTWTDKSGKKHPATQVQGHQSRKADKDADKETKDTMKKEAVEPEFKSKFMKMVEAKKKEKEDAKAKKMEEAKKAKMKKKAEPMEEGSKPDFLDLDKDGNKKEPMKSAAKSKGGDKEESGKKGMSDAQKKYFGGKNESKVALKKVVAESVEQKLTFKEMMKIVVESGGQQQIDPVDKALFNWAQRVAASKFNEGMKAEVYAGLIYERNGGRFELYDVLSEDQK